MRTKGLREVTQGLVSYKEEYRRKLNYKKDTSVCWTVEDIWLRVWERGIIQRVFYVWIWHWSCWCWLLINTADCWWLLLIAGWLLVAAGILLNGGKVFDYFQIILFCGLDNFAGEKVFQYFQDIDVLRLRQLCRRKSLWVLPRYWRFAAKTFLQARKSLNISRILMFCG